MRRPADSWLMLPPWSRMTPPIFSDDLPMGVGHLPHGGQAGRGGIHVSSQEPVRLSTLTACARTRGRPPRHGPPARHRREKGHEPSARAALAMSLLSGAPENAGGAAENAAAGSTRPEGPQLRDFPATCAPPATGVPGSRAHGPRANGTRHRRESPLQRHPPAQAIPRTIPAASGTFRGASRPGAFIAAPNPLQLSWLDTHRPEFRAPGGERGESE